jgi:hypothetical protein
MVLQTRNLRLSIFSGNYFHEVENRNKSSPPPFSLKNCGKMDIPWVFGSATWLVILVLKLVPLQRLMFVATWPRATRLCCSSSKQWHNLQISCIRTQISPNQFKFSPNNIETFLTVAWLDLFVIQTRYDKPVMQKTWGCLFHEKYFLKLFHVYLILEKLMNEK